MAHGVVTLKHFTTTKWVALRQHKGVVLISLYWCYNLNVCPNNSFENEKAFLRQFKIKLSFSLVSKSKSLVKSALESWKLGLTKCLVGMSKLIKSQKASGAKDLAKHKGCKAQKGITTSIKVWFWSHGWKMARVVEKRKPCKCRIKMEIEVDEVAKVLAIGNVFN